LVLASIGASSQKVKAHIPVLESFLVTSMDFSNIFTLIDQVASSGKLDDFIIAWNMIEKPDAAVYLEVLKRIRKRLNEDTIFDWAKGLTQRNEASCRSLACFLLSIGNPFKRYEGVVSLLLELADDSSWETRESAASCLADVLHKNFEEFYPAMAGWVRHLSENVRRAVVVAAKKVGQKRVPGRGELLLQLIEPLLMDTSVYVRKNLGAFAIGDGLLRAYPELTLAYVKKWSLSDDEQVLWNVAMVFSSAEAVKHRKEALPILRRLACDRRRFVWRAAASALRNLVRRRPEEVACAIEDWDECERLRIVKRIALGAH